METNIPDPDPSIWVDDDMEPETLQFPAEPGGFVWTGRRIWALVAVTFLIGAIIGQTVGGWWLWPVEWTDATVAQLSDYDKANTVVVASRLYAFDGNSNYPARLFDGWPPAERDQFICTMARMSGDPAKTRNLLELLWAVGGSCG